MRLEATEVVVIGGGAVGAGVAYYLARAGRRVVLVERRGLAHEASGANVGLVTLFSAYSLEEPEPGPLFGLTRESVDLYATLGEEVGVDIEYEREGGVVTAETEAQAATASRSSGSIPPASARASPPSSRTASWAAPSARSTVRSTHSC